MESICEKASEPSNFTPTPNPTKTPIYYYSENILGNERKTTLAARLNQRYEPQDTFKKWQQIKDIWTQKLISTEPLNKIVSICLNTLQRVLRVCLASTKANINPPTSIKA